ncbi:MAG TPA: hypothetical protein VLH41_00770, partial [Thermoanaerobaculia bacterium]|nr:hypothetical protein [Thermoanaerobaculia bacterium]
MRLVGAVGLLLVLGSALNLPLQRTPAAAAIPALLFFAFAALRPAAAAAFLLAAAPLLPIAGTLLHGPWIAPAEVALLSGAAGILASRTEGGPIRGELVAPLSIAALAAAAGGIAATVAALSPGQLPGALANVGRNLFGLSGNEAAAPLRAALVHAAPLFAFLAVRRAAARSGAAAVLNVSLAGGALVAAYAVAEAAFSLKLWPPAFYETASGMKRVVSTLSDYHSAGAYCALLLLPAAAGAARARGPRRLLGLGLSALLFLGLLL